MGLIFTLSQQTEARKCSYKEHGIAGVKSSVALKPVRNIALMTTSHGDSRRHIPIFTTSPHLYYH
jgi:hypothetical protein